MEEENKSKPKKEKTKLGKKIGNIVFYSLFSIFLLIAAFSLTSRITNGRFFDSQFLVVLSGSMDGEKQEEYEIQNIPIKSLIKIDLIKDGKEDEFYSSLKKGDVLTFNYASLNNTTITHRIIEDPILLSDGTYQYKLKGDAVEGAGDYQMLYSDGRTGEIIGKVSYVSPFLGQIYFFVSSKLGTLLLVILPSSAICIFEIAKIIYIVIGNKNKAKIEKEAKKSEAKDKEIEELKAKLNALENKSDNNDSIKE